MKKIYLFFFVFFILLIGLFLFARYLERKMSEAVLSEDVILSEKTEDVSVSQIDAYLSKVAEPIVWTDVQNTSELAELFKDARYDEMPKIFVRRFPDDFSQNGSPVLMATVLLPHILFQNNSPHPL